MNCLQYLVILFVLIRTAASQALTCGGAVYDPENDLCCSDVLYAGKNLEIEWCCGNKSFDSRTHKCDEGVRVQKTIEETMTCSANGTMTVMNDNAGLYAYAMAMQGALTPEAKRCTVDITNNPVIKIYGCSVGKVVTLFLSSTDSFQSDVVGGQGTNLRSVALRCAGIPDTGFIVTVDNFITAHVTIPTVTFTAAPYLVLESKIWDPATLAFTGQAMAGATLSWSIRLPDDHSGVPVSCTAYSGTNSGGSPSKKIVSDGCSQEKGLIGDFTVVNSPGLNGLTAPLWAFSFYNSPNVYLHCSVRICPPGSTSCDFSCDDRKRRAIDVPNKDDIRDSGVVLHILQPQIDIPISDASKLEGVLTLIGVCLAVTLADLLISHIR